MGKKISKAKIFFGILVVTNVAMLALGKLCGYRFDKWSVMGEDGIEFLHKKIILSELMIFPLVISAYILLVVPLLCLFTKEFYI